MKTKRSLLAASLAIALAPSLAQASCGAAFCAVNSNWTTESALAGAANSFDLRYEYVDQDQPMFGSDKVGVGQIHAHHDEVSTLNRNLVGSYSHNFNNGFGVTVSANVGAREHLHIHNHHGAKLNEEWDFTRLGDVRVVGRYQLNDAVDPLAPANSGITFGVKLPTGAIDVANGAGDPAERSMQPGTGTTDLIAGAYYHKKLPSVDASWFVQAQYQHAVNSRDNYRPGAQLGLDAGVRKGVAGNFALLGQVNYVHKRADRGSEAEPASSGGRYLYVSPGVSYAISDGLQAYAFLQVPAYRHVRGVQLTADKAVLIGVSGQL
ncbi:MAG: transporter [Gammaproteobacteria bacterium]